MPGTGPQAGHAPSAGAAPGRLEVVRLFVNTLDIELGTDELRTPAALAGWLAAHGLLPGSRAHDQDDPRAAPASRPAALPPQAAQADVGQAIALREALRGVLRSHVGTGAPMVVPEAMGVPGTAVVPDAAAADGPAAELSRIAGALPVRLVAGHDGELAAAPAGTGPPAALAGLLLIAAEAAVAGTWSRLKVCSADDCRWAFYDRSPTRNGCWCSMAVCGSRAKSRAYRRRAAARR